MPTEPSERDIVRESESIIESVQAPDKLDEVDVERLQIASQRAKTRRSRDIRFCIITVLAEELAALKLILEGWEEEHNNISAVAYFRASVPSRENPQLTHKIIVACVFNMGNSSSAVAATSVLKDFRYVKDLLMVGIAGGVPAPKDPDTDVRLGDVVVSARKGLVQYDMIKLEANSRPIIRSVMPPPSPRLLGDVTLLESEKLENRHPWETHIERATKANESWSRPRDNTDPNHSKWRPNSPRGRRKGQPFIHLGVIGSANTLLKSPTVRNNLKKTLQIIAVEMDGSGIADAAWVFGAGYLVIRGVSDYCDRNKSKVQNWRQYASLAAASYARALLESMPLR